MSKEGKKRKKAETRKLLVQDGGMAGYEDSCKSKYSLLVGGVIENRACRSCGVR